MKDVNAYSHLHLIGVPVHIIVDIDIIKSTSQYRTPSELGQFRDEFLQYGKDGKEFDEMVNISGDGFRTRLAKRQNVSLQRGLRQLHNYPQTYIKQHSDTTMPFKEFLCREQVFRCCVSIGSSGDSPDRLQADLGYVYLRSSDGLKKADTVMSIQEYKRKAYIQTMFSESLDAILNIGETVISKMEHDGISSEQREIVEKSWDSVWTTLRKELEDTENWEVREKDCLFKKTDSLLNCIEKLYDLCKAFWHARQKTDRFAKAYMIKLNEGWANFQKEKCEFNHMEPP